LIAAVKSTESYSTILLTLNDLVDNHNFLNPVS